ncbi:hypothetical protein SDJN03_30175, partial [Cucurbita argyrosperma subsp. sororia]
MDIFFYLPSITCPTSYLCYRKSKYPSAFWPLTFIPLMWLKLDARPDPTSVNSTAASKPALDDAGQMGNSLSVSHLGVGNSAYGSQRYGIPDFGIDLPEVKKRISLWTDSSVAKIKDQGSHEVLNKNPPSFSFLEDKNK